MLFNDDQIACYEADGFLNLGQLFMPAEVAALREEASRIGSPARDLSDANLVDEKTGVIWRSYSMDMDSEAFRVATRLPRLLDRARQLLGPKIYLWQAHMNHKVAGRGEAWHWHQDYANWRLDGIPQGGLGDVVTFMVMLDESRPDNGPLKIFRGSHRVDRDDGYWDAETAKFAVQAVDEAQLEELRQSCELVDCLGPAGTVVMFSGLAVHGSEENQSSFPRCVAYFAYNRNDNRPTRKESLRPHVSPYQFNPDPVELDATVGDDALLRLADRAGAAA